MHRTVLLTPLLALALASACGGKGEQTAGELDGRALEDQGPPADDQRPPPSQDQPPPSESPSTPEDDSCESVCEAAEAVCVIPGCVNSCREGSSDFPQCHSEWLAVLRCLLANDLICERGDSEEMFERCASQYAAVNRCAGFFEEEEEEEEEEFQ